MFLLTKCGFPSLILTLVCPGVPVRFMEDSLYLFSELLTELRLLWIVVEQFLRIRMSVPTLVLYSLAIAFLIGIFC